ncbi:type IV pilus twitching motility protein PilT [Protaetiibacter sp. SSC-01]|uniref:type IV pilus twitching motility protein PilT n=1 Tax=Protaetiibacter sp. SSC-01 TaxID=2759943 RepID=UPI00292A57AA|nr:type IV pilus twitching motility protein PilT [Protaetiibacter sp. SSC-01]
MNNNIYEIPLTDPAAPPFGAPGTSGALPPQPGVLPPDAVPSVDFSQLPPPGMSAAPSSDAPSPVPPSASVPPVPPPAASFSDSAPPVFPPAGGIPGFTEAPTVDLTTPSFAAAPPPPLPTAAVAPAAPVPAETLIDDEFARAARANADADLLHCLQEVLLAGASDLHISTGTSPLLRIDGTLTPVHEQPIWDREKTATALYSILSPTQRAKFDEVLELDFAFTLSANARFRVNFYQQRGAIGGAFRIIPTEIKSLSQLGVPPQVGEFAKLPRGLVLVTGPTGSGKSTTLAALIDQVNQTRRDHVVTVEDPIEFLHNNKKALINQREVGADTHSFANALKHVLRQDPDVILIGELRDLETISVALTAAETGHLVFATLHTQSAASTIDRVIDVFPPHQQDQIRVQLAATLQGVVCQTLVKRANGRGRAVATEVMFITPAIANLVREGKTYQVTSSLQSGAAQGMHTMDQHLADLVNGGEVAYEHALEKVQDLETFNRLVTRRDLNNNAQAARSI